MPQVTVQLDETPVAAVLRDDRPSEVNVRKTYSLDGKVLWEGVVSVTVDPDETFPANYKYPTFKDSLKAHYVTHGAAIKAAMAAKNPQPQNP